MRLIHTVPALLVGLFCTTAGAAGNPVNDQFSAMSADDRGGRISSMLATRGQACSSIRREMFQGQLPDGLALWSFSCALGTDWQLIIFANQDIQLVACTDIAKNPKLLPCFAAVPPARP